MKNKVLLSTLLGGALLAACSTDDAFEMNRKVAEKVTPAAPVFTVSFGNDLTRAAMATDGEHAMKWESIDRMSLYHGGGDIKTAPSWSVTKYSDDNFLASGEVRKSDAIYSLAGGEGSTPVFTTASMVNDGLAIMIYPADTAYVQDKQNPHIKLDNEQNEQTKNLTPHISEVLEITAHGSLDDTEADNSHSAGYGRNYDIVMRQIAAQLRLTLNGENDESLKNLGVTVKFRKVKMTVADATKSPFTTDTEVKIGKERRYVAEDGSVKGDVNVGKNTPDHKYWKYTPWLEPAEDGTAAFVSTTDIEDNSTAIFTLLPYDDREDYASAAFKDGEAQYGNVTIEVETNYGKVTVKDDEKGEQKLWSNRLGTKETINGGLARFLQQVFKPQDKGDELYSGQLLAGGGQRFLSVDLSDLDMNGLHIQDEAELMDVLKVYTNLKEQNDKAPGTTFILDGNENGKFVMTKETWEAVEERLAKTGNNVHFALCADEAPCTAIVLKNEEGKPAEEVPALTLVNTLEGSKVQNKTAIELEGAWKYTSVTDNQNTNKEAVLKALDVNKLIVKKDATLELTAEDHPDKNYIAATGKVIIEVENGATVKVDDIATLQLDMNNKGLMTIDGQLAVDQDVTLTNYEPQGKDADAWDENADKGGVIELKGTLAIVDKTTGIIDNYGKIDMQSADARLLITNNQTEDAKANELFTNEEQAKDTKHGYTTRNVFGVIYLSNQNITAAQVKIKNSDKRNGFIKSEYFNAKHNEIANYSVVMNKADWEGGSSKAPAYVEIQASEEVNLKTATAKTLQMLVVPTGKKVFCSVDVTIGTSLYVKGTITHTGGFSYEKTQLSGYFGGEEEDYSRIFSWGTDAAPEE